jgi:hypothetical protein
MPGLRRVRAALLVGILLSCSVTLMPGHAHATTGPYNNLPNSKFKIPPSIQTLYRGQYVLKSSARGARLSSGATGIETSATGFLYGVVQFYGYSKTGSRITWVATLYNFRQLHKQMVFDLLASGTTTVLGNSSVTRAKTGDFAGLIRLGTGTYSISWTKISAL